MFKKSNNFKQVHKNSRRKLTRKITAKSNEAVKNNKEIKEIQKIKKKESQKKQTKMDNWNK